MQRLFETNFRIKASELLFALAILTVHSAFGQQSKSAKRVNGPDFIAKSNAMILKNEIYSEDFFNVVMESGKCSSTGENKVRYYVNFGMAMLAKGSYSSALEKFQKALELVEKKALDYDKELIEFNIAIVKLGLNRKGSLPILDFTIIGEWLNWG
jgi:tetratricopeptide (TPR) repeat protein